MWRRASSMARSLRLIWDVCEFNGVKGREGISENGDVLIVGHIRRSPLYSAHLWLRTPSASAISRPTFMAEAVSSSRTSTRTLQPTTIVIRRLLLARSILGCFLDRCSRFRNRERNRLSRDDRNSREEILIRWK